MNDKDLRAVAEFAGIDLDTIKLPQYVNDTRSDTKLKLQTDESSMAILRAFHKAGYRVVHETILASTFVHTERYVGNAHYEQGVKARAGSLNAAIREAARRYVKEKP